MTRLASLRWTGIALSVLLASAAGAPARTAAANMAPAPNPLRLAPAQSRPTPNPLRLGQIWPVQNGPAQSRPAQAKPAQTKIIQASATQASLFHPRKAQTCSPALTRAIPARRRRAPTGSKIMRQVMGLSGVERDAVIEKQLLSGNLPQFLRKLAPVSFSGKLADGRDVLLTICVTMDYLAIGSDGDFVRIPMGLPAAAEIADRFGFTLPTTRMVDAIYKQAAVHLAPRPMPAGRQMSSTSYLLRHNQTVDGQMSPLGPYPTGLTAGQKKDLVLSNRLRKARGRVAIYGWHRGNGRPIQPLSTVHGAQYADYSHGVRLISDTAFVNGQPRALSDIMQDRQLAGLISSEGPIPSPRRLLASLYR